MVGQKLSIEFKGGATKVMIGTETGDSDITLDGNHPLAGQELIFALKMEQVVSQTAQEMTGERSVDIAGV